MADFFLGWGCRKVTLYSSCGHAGQGTLPSDYVAVTSRRGSSSRHGDRLMRPRIAGGTRRGSGDILDVKRSLQGRSPEEDSLSFIRPLRPARALLSLDGPCWFRGK